VAGDQRFVADGPGVRLARPAQVVNLYDEAQAGQRGDRRRHSPGESRVVHQHACLRLRQQMQHLVVEVPVVDVRRHGADLERGVEGLEVLAAVVQVDRDRVACADAGRGHRRGKPAGAVVELAPRPHAGAVDDRRVSRVRVGYRFPRGREVLVQCQLLWRR
jgi:hypothetical protein